MPQSQILLFEHIVQGQAQKEVFSNEADDILERKIANSADISIAGTGNFALTNDAARDMRINFTGVLTGDRTIDLPGRNMLYVFENTTTGAFVVDIQVTGGAGTSIELGRGYQLWLWTDGVDVFDLTRQMNDYAVDVSTTYQATPYDRVINGDTGGGAFTITLPAPVPGKQVLITRVGATNTLTIARGGTDTIQGAATSKTITTQWAGILFVGDTTTNWNAFALTNA
jgi:hypothetical protein